jgi:LysM repeat protein
MSIKLDWDVSEAPHDDELTPSLLTNNPKRPAPWPGSGGPTGQPLPARARRGRSWLIGLAVLIALAGVGLWYTQAGWQRVSNGVQAAVTYEDQQATLGATNLLLNVQDRGNLDWMALRRDESQARQPAPLPLPMLSFDPAPPKMAGLTALDTEFMLASVSRQFTTPDGQTLTFNLPQFYRRDVNGDWLRSAPPGSFWGHWLDWHGANLDIRYSERDADFVVQAAALLDQRLADACTAWAGGCPSQRPIRLYLSGFVGSLEYDPLSNIEVRVEVSTTSGAASASSDYFLSVPSPQIAGIPADEAARSYLSDYLAVRLIAELARQISTSPDGYAQRTSQAIQALGLTNADPGYAAAISGGWRQGPAAGGSVSLPRDSAPVKIQDRTASSVIWYQTAPGDTLAAIATRFNTSASAIARENSLDEANPLALGVKLIIPVLNPAGAAP